MFSPPQTDILRAAMNRIIPPDEYPGAWDAGAGDYLFGLLKRDLPQLVVTYGQGLDALDEEAKAVYNAGFAALDAAVQDALLSQIERGAVKIIWPIDPAAFFRMLVDHTIEGYYSDPGNGGNRDQAAWRMIGFEVRG
jgi:gluconate 2-dehydrogenase gamma chain